MEGFVENNARNLFATTTLPKILKLNSFSVSSYFCFHLRRTIISPSICRVFGFEKSVYLGFKYDFTNLCGAIIFSRIFFLEKKIISQSADFFSADLPIPHEYDHFSKKIQPENFSERVD